MPGRGRLGAGREPAGRHVASGAGLAALVAEASEDDIWWAAPPPPPPDFWPPPDECCWALDMLTLSLWVLVWEGRGRRRRAGR